MNHDLHNRHRPAISWATVFVAALAPVLGGCSYALQGRVIRGDASYVEVVDSGDPRLSEPKAGMSGVSIHLQGDPSNIRRKTLGRTASGGNGGFSVPVDEFGAGMLDYDVGVFARRKGCEPAEGYFRLPGSGKRVLVVMAPGDDRETREQPSSLEDEFNVRSWTK